MELASKAHVMASPYQRISQKRRLDLPTQLIFCRRPSTHGIISSEESLKIGNHRLYSTTQTTTPVQNLEIPEDFVSIFKDFTVAVTAYEHRERKIRVSASSAMTQSIFDDVFTNLVAAAQPIPGFRRVKGGGKTPDIPKEILLHIIGPSKAYSQSIKKIINCTVAAYVEKKGLKVSKDLQVQQNLEELQAAFQPGKDFSLDAIIQLQETDTSNN